LTPSAPLGQFPLVRFRGLRHLPPQIGEQIAPRDEAKKFLAIHNDGDAAAVKNRERSESFAEGVSVSSLSVIALITAALNCKESRWTFTKTSDSGCIP